jgi:stringent starvation protein B
MTSLKPYLIRSVYDWIVDNDLTPHLLVDATHSQAVVPQQFANDGKIVLNIRPQAIEALSLGNEEIHFNARFSGKAMYIIVPVSAVLAIYAKENNKGMGFDPEEYADTDAPSPPEPEKKPPTKPNLRIVK